jgi:selenocysteine lyase/cysteine desulfurase
VGIKNIPPDQLAKTLFEKYKIFTVAINSANVFGVRVTPHLYTTTNELDIFIKALKELAKS